MMTDKAKLVTKEIRAQLRAQNISNRNVSVTCKSTREQGKNVEIIYVIVLISNTELDITVNNMVEKFKRKYGTKTFRFMFFKSDKLQVMG